jgi:hypothetical protein
MIKHFFEHLRANTAKLTKKKKKKKTIA